VARPRTEGAPEFWSAVGGAFKASVDYCVTVSCLPGALLERGPEVRTRTVRTSALDGPRGTLEESHAVGGVVRGPDGEPLRDAWVVLPEAGAWAVSDAAGRFRFERVRPGTYRCAARAPDGLEVEAELTVPGRGVELAIGGDAERPRTRKRR
jgi:hypothetical protein